MKTLISKISLILFAIAFALTFTSCEKSELIAPNDNEMILKSSGGDGQSDDCDGDITDDEDDEEDDDSRTVPESR